jgi:hypothetical protein
VDAWQDSRKEYERQSEFAGNEFLQMSHAGVETSCRERNFAGSVS